MEDIIPQKQCTRCKQIYPLTSEYFSRDSRKKSGFVSRCKACWKLYQQDYNSKPETKAMKYEYNHRPERLEYEQARRQTPEYIKAEQTRKASPEYKEWQRKYARSPAGKAVNRAGHHNRRIREGKRLSKIIILQVHQEQKGVCWWCGKSAGDDYHIDHRIAVSRGGTNALGNLVVSCADCNHRKYNKLPWEWAGRLL